MLDERRVDLCNYRMKNSEDSLTVAEDCMEKGLYRDAINRSYYAAFYAIKALLALEEVDFKRHKDVLAYFNKNYINKEIFPRMMGRKIQNASAIREDSDYDDEFIVDADKTNEQLKTAEELIELVDKYIDEN